LERADYIKAYNDHHRASGVGGSGSGDLDVKLDLIESAGLSGSCLDYGCGWGQLAQSFEDYVGVDISHEALNLARVINPGKTFKLLPCSLDRQFDFGVCLSVLTHDLNPSEVLADLFKYVPVALVDIIHGEGGTWELMRRNVDVFKGYKYTHVGSNTSRYGIEHSYYRIERATGE
jgi:2-polyprenyl-3-methyl-5-hydroxy-6-metoxy-1,4-benzoquinol methylase